MADSVTSVCFGGKSDRSASHSFSPALESKLNSLKENADQTRTHTELASAPGSRRQGLPGRRRFSAAVYIARFIPPGSSFRCWRSPDVSGCCPASDARARGLVRELPPGFVSAFAGLLLGSRSLTSSQLDVRASLFLPVPLLGGRWALCPLGAHPCLPQTAIPPTALLPAPAQAPAAGAQQTRSAK